VFIFRVITNEVNRNRRKLILLSVEKSHIAVYPCDPPRLPPFRPLPTPVPLPPSRPPIFLPTANGGRDACAPLLCGAGVARGWARRFSCGSHKENRTDSPLGRRIKIIPLISDFRVLKTRVPNGKARQAERIGRGLRFGAVDDRGACKRRRYDGKSESRVNATPTPNRDAREGCVPQTLHRQRSSGEPAGVVLAGAKRIADPRPSLARESARDRESRENRSGAGPRGTR